MLLGAGLASKVRERERGRNYIHIRWRSEIVRFQWSRSTPSALVGAKGIRRVYLVGISNEPDENRSQTRARQFNNGDCARNL